MREYLLTITYPTFISLSTQGRCFNPTTLVVSVHVLQQEQRLEYSGSPICNPQRYLARSILFNLRLVLFTILSAYTSKELTASPHTLFDNVSVDAVNIRCDIFSYHITYIKTLSYVFSVSH